MAITAARLGNVAQEQQRFAEAEEHYRLVLDTFDELGDRHHAASVQHQFGALLPGLNRHHDALTVLVAAAHSGWTSTGAWPVETLGLIRRELSRLPVDEGDRAIDAALPADAAENLRSALDD